MVTFGRESNYGYGRKADFHAVERHGSRSVNTIFKGAVDTNVILLTLAHPQPLFFYAYLQPFLVPLQKSTITFAIVDF